MGTKKVEVKKGRTVPKTIVLNGANCHEVCSIIRGLLHCQEVEVEVGDKKIRGIVYDNDADEPFILPLSNCVTVNDPEGPIVLRLLITNIRSIRLVDHYDDELPSWVTFENGGIRVK